MSCQQKHPKNSPAQKRYEFYKHLKTYLTISGIFTLLHVFKGGGLHVPDFVFWWGIGVAIHYLSVFGWNSLFHQESQDERVYLDDEVEEEPEPLVEMKDKATRPTWRDRDLV